MHSCDEEVTAERHGVVIVTGTYKSTVFVIDSLKGTSVLKY
jgi:hypothetical protein